MLAYGEKMLRNKSEIIALTLFKPMENPHLKKSPWSPSRNNGIEESLENDKFEGKNGLPTTYGKAKGSIRLQRWKMKQVWSKSVKSERSRERVHWYWCQGTAKAREICLSSTPADVDEVSAAQTARQLLVVISSLLPSQVQSGLSLNQVRGIYRQWRPRQCAGLCQLLCFIPHSQWPFLPEEALCSYFCCLTIVSDDLPNDSTLFSSLLAGVDVLMMCICTKSLQSCLKRPYGL